MSNFKKYKSMMGYRDDSPFKDESYIDINTPTGVIDMSQTGIPLFANGQLLPPYSGQYNMGTTKVREIPATRGYIDYEPREENIMGGLSHTFDNTTLSVNGVLPIQANQYNPFKGALGFGLKGKVGNTSVGIGVDKSFVNNPFTGEHMYTPFQPKISIKHNFQGGGENDDNMLDDVVVTDSKNEQTYYPDYNFYDLTNEKQKLLEKLQSEAFKNRYYKQYENVTGNQITDEEYNQRLADQIKFIQEGTNQATPIMYKRGEDGNINIWQDDEELKGKKLPHKYAAMHPDFLSDYFNQSRGHVQYLFEKDEDGEIILDENGNPTMTGWDMGLLGPKEYEALENVTGPDGYSQFSAPDGVHPYAHSTMQHELSHLYNSEYSPLWMGVEGYDENASYITDIFGEDQPWYADEHTKNPAEIGAGKVMFEQALMDYGIWDPNKGEFGDKHLKKLNKAIEKNKKFISDPRVGNFLFVDANVEDGVTLQRPEVNEYLESIGVSNNSSNYLYDYGDGISGVIGPRMMESDLNNSLDIINRYESKYEEMPSRKEAKSEDHNMSNWRWNKKRNKEEDKLMNKFLSNKGIKDIQDPDYDILYDFNGSFINDYMNGAHLENLYYKGETSDAEFFTSSNTFKRNHPGFDSAPKEIKEKYAKKYQELLAGDNLNTLVDMLGNSSKGWNYKLGNLYNEETEEDVPYTGQPLSDEDIAFYKDFETQYQDLSNQLKTELYEYHKNQIDNKGENVKKYLNEIAMEEDASMDNTVMAKYGSEIEEENQIPIPQGMLETVNVGPGGDAIEYYKERLPYYDTLTSDQRQHLNDVRLGKVPQSKIFDAIVMQGREGYGIGNNPTYMQSVHDFATALPTLAGKGILETLTIPQATLVEGIEAAKGNPYNFKNVLPTADKNLFSNQRFPSNTFLQDAPLGWQIAGDIGIDPAAIFGLGKLGQLGVRSLNAAARNRKLATTLSSAMDDALTTPTNYNTFSRPASIFDGANPGFGQSDELVDDAYKAIGSIGEDKIYSTSQIGDLTVTNASKNLLTDMSNAANTGKFVDNSFPQIGVAGGKLNVPNKTQITKFDDALNTAFDYKGMEDGTNVALTRIIDSKGLAVENGKLTFKIAPHMEGSKEALKIQNYDDIIKKRNTTHLSFSHIQGNEYHGSHGAGDWRNKSTAVINNINDLKKHGELLNISPSDTYFYTKNNMFVGDQAIVLTRDKKLYNNVIKNSPNTNIYYVGKNVDNNQFAEIVNSFHRTAGSSQDMNKLFHNYVGNELVEGRNVGRFKVSKKDQYLKDFSSDNPNTFSGGFAGHDATHGGSLLSDLEKAANFKNLKYMGPELKYGVNPSGNLPSRQGTRTDLIETYSNPYLMNNYVSPGNIHHQSKLLNKYIPYPEMKESPRAYKNWLKENSFEELSNYPIEVQINEIEKLVSSGFDTKLLNTHKEWLALSNGFDTWTDMVAKSGYNTMKKYGGESLTKFQDKGEFKPSSQMEVSNPMNPGVARQDNVGNFSPINLEHARRNNIEYVAAPYAGKHIPGDVTATDR